jgi:hypothetical protein
MFRFRALAMTFCCCGLLSLGAGAAWADGARFGGWRFGGPYFGGPRFMGPSFAGPRYDGPPGYDLDEPLPPPHGGPPDDTIVIPGGPPGRALAGPPPSGPRKCYNPAETRDRVASANLHEPFALMRKASAMTQAEAIAAKLCRWNDQDIYDISLLRRDGMLIHVFLNAATGAVVGALNAH